MGAVPETMFSAHGIVPWHKIGEVIDECLTSDEALIKSGCDWEVEKLPMFLADGSPVKDSFAVCRKDRVGDEAILGVVGKNYFPVQNADAFRFTDELVGGHYANYETAGVLMGGKRVWMMMNLPDDIRIEGTDDTIKKYIGVTNGHDGKWTLKAAVITERWVCKNTIDIGLATAISKISLRHTPNVMGRAAEAQKLLGIAKLYYDEFELMANAINKIPVSADFVDRYVRALVPTYDKMPNRLKANRQMAQDTIKELFETADTCNLPGIRGTAWSLFNAATEYADWRKRKGEDEPFTESRLASIWWGEAATFKQNAYDKLITLLN